MLGGKAMLCASLLEDPDRWRAQVWRGSTVAKWPPDNPERANRRNAGSRGRLFCRLLQQAVDTDPQPLHSLLKPESNPNYT